MAATLKPYPTMKDSGVSWLGEVPAHWKVRRLAQVGKLSKGSGGSKDDEVSTGIPCIRYGDLYTTHNYFIRKSRSFIPKDKTPEYTAIKFGDVLFAGSGEIIDEIGKSAVNLMQEEACCGGDVILFRPTRQIEPRYLGYATDCRPAAAQKAIMGRGITIMHIYGTQLKYLTLPLPPLPEQTAIVRFLDHADRRIRRYIHAKQKLIALLEEQQQAIIHQAVTGQIDVRTGQPYPAYKPSGVEWLGEVPAHWEVKKLKTVVQLIDGDRGPDYPGEGDYVVKGIPFLSSKNIVGNRLKLDKVTFISEEKFHSLGRGKLQAGDLIITVRGTIGSIAVFNGEEHETGFINAQMMIIRPSRAIKSEFLHYLAQSDLWRKQLSFYSYGSAQQQLSGQILRNVYLAVPSVREQEGIVAHLRYELAKVNGVVHSTLESIALLQEYKSILISNAVTGKLDVREAAAARPEVDPLAAENTPDDSLETNAV